MGGYGVKLNGSKSEIGVYGNFLMLIKNSC